MLGPVTRIGASPATSGMLGRLQKPDMATMKGMHAHEGCQLYGTRCLSRHFCNAERFAESLRVQAMYEMPPYAPNKLSSALSEDSEPASDPHTQHPIGLPLHEPDKAEFQEGTAPLYTSFRAQRQRPWCAVSRSESCVDTSGHLNQVPSWMVPLPFLSRHTSRSEGKEYRFPRARSLSFFFFASWDPVGPAFLTQLHPEVSHQGPHPTSEASFPPRTSRCSPVSG